MLNLFIIIRAWFEGYMYLGDGEFIKKNLVSFDWDRGYRCSRSNVVKHINWRS